MSAFIITDVGFQFVITLSVIIFVSNRLISTENLICVLGEFTGELAGWFK